MEVKETKDLIKSAIAAETENARKKWGETYHSEHEAWAVLTEEIEEANDALVKIVTIQRVLWSFVRKPKIESEDIKYIKEDLRYLQDHCQELAIEATQIAAVARKYLDSIPEAE